MTVNLPICQYLLFIILLKLIKTILCVFQFQKYHDVYEHIWLLIQTQYCEIVFQMRTSLLHVISLLWQHECIILFGFFLLSLIYIQWVQLIWLSFKLPSKVLQLFNFVAQKTQKQYCIQYFIKMSSLRFSNRDKNNKKYLQPPTLHNFDICSSQDRQQQYGEQIQQLSNVEQKSFFQSEPQQPDKKDLQNFLEKMKKIGDNKLIPQSPRKSQRLQDQQIIVVEEENQIGQNLGNNQSLILQQLQFANETHPENTPQWQNGEDGVKNNKDQIKYVINLISDSPNFIAKDHQNLSSSSPWDIESSQYKINHNRNSKNTCIDRLELLDSQNNIQNKSCVEKPISYEEQIKNSKKLHFPSQQKNKNKNFQFILNKWKNQVYPIYPLPQAQSNQLGRRGSADFQMQRDAKFCTSKYKVQSSRGNIDEEFDQSLKEKDSKFYTQKSIQKNLLRINDNSLQEIKSKTSIMDKVNKQVQTNLSERQIVEKQYKLNEEINKLKTKNDMLQNQLLRLKEKLESQATQLNKTRQSLKNKDYQLQKFKSTSLRNQTSEQQKKWGEQSRRLTQKNKQLQKKINIQNQTIKQFQQKNQALEKKLNKTVSFNTFYSTERSPTFFGSNIESQSVKFNKMFTSENDQISIHEKCKKQIEQLQQYIFDLQQKFAGIDIEVQKRVNIISETIELQITNRLNQQHKVIVAGLKQQLNKYQQGYKLLQYKNRQFQQKWDTKQQQLYQKQKEVNKMYEQLKKQWKQIEKQSQMQKKYLYKNQPKMNKYYSPKAATKSRFDNQKQDSNLSNMIYQSEKLSPFLQKPSQYLYCSNKEIKTPNFKRDGLSYIKNTQNNTSVSYMAQQDKSFRRGASRMNESQKPNLSYTRAIDQNQWEKRQTTKTEFQQNNQLAAINNKIQRLRKQINKELCSIH